MKRGNHRSRKAYKQDAQRNSHNHIAKGTGARSIYLEGKSSPSDISIVRASINALKSMFRRRTP